MTRAGAARKLAAAAAYGGGGLSVLGASLYGVLKAEAKLARRAIGHIEDPVPDPSGWYGRGRPGPAVRIALLGDSSAAGYGVTTVEETTGSQLASGVATAVDRRVHLEALCRSGVKSNELAEQVDVALTTEPDVAVILVGANDVTNGTLPAKSVRALAEQVRRLREADVEVVVGTCPDLGTVRPIPQPLRAVAKEWSRRLAAAQTIAVVEAGGRSVSLATILGPEFAAAPALLFGPDQFHPSAAGYASLAAVLVPSVVAALGLAPDDEAHPEALRGEGVLPIGYAAVQASRTPGTELDGTDVGGAKRGAGGRWVTLMRRRRQPPVDAESPEDEETVTAGSRPGSATDD